MPNQYSLITIAIITLCSASILNAQADEIRSTLSEQRNVAVTIYNNNLALIKDQRAVNLPNGVNTLALRDV
ncbi:MAG: DUF4139 domain-containing protein, partial [Methylotenera sp.]